MNKLIATATQVLPSFCENVIDRDLATWFWEVATQGNMRSIQDGLIYSLYIKLIRCKHSPFLYLS